MKWILILVLSCGLNSVLLGQHSEKNHKEKFKFGDLFNQYAHPNFSSTSITVGVGLSAYAGDISNFSDVSKQHYHLNPNLHLGIQSRLSDYISFRLEAGYFKLYSESVLQQTESYSFRSHNFDIEAAFQLDLVPKTYLDSRYRKVSPYVFGGIGMVRYNPVNDVDNTSMTESSERTSLIFPVGFGITFLKSDALSLGVEFSNKFTLTDKLDGIINDGSTPINDKYLLYGLKANINLPNQFKYHRYLKRMR